MRLDVSALSELRGAARGRGALHDSAALSGALPSRAHTVDPARFGPCDDAWVAARSGRRAHPFSRGAAAGRGLSLPLRRRRPARGARRATAVPSTRTPSPTAVRPAAAAAPPSPSSPFPTTVGGRDTRRRRATRKHQTAVPTCASYDDNPRARHDGQRRRRGFERSESPRTSARSAGTRLPPPRVPRPRRRHHRERAPAVTSCSATASSSGSPRRATAPRSAGTTRPPQAAQRLPAARRAAAAERGAPARPPLGAAASPVAPRTAHAPPAAPGSPHRRGPTVTTPIAGRRGAAAERREPAGRRRLGGAATTVASGAGGA